MPVPEFEHVGNQHRVVERGDLYAALCEHHPVELHVLSDFEHPRGFEQRLQQRERLGLCELARREPAAIEQVVCPLAMSDRDVAGFARRNGERNAHYLGLHRIERGRLGAEGDDAGLERARDPAAEVGGGGDRLVGGNVDLLGPGARGALRGEALRGRNVLGLLDRRGWRGRRRRRRLGFAAAAAPTRRADEKRIGLDRVDVHAADLADAAGDGGEFHRLQEGDQLFALQLRHAQRIQRNLAFYVAHEGHQFLRDADQRHRLRVGQRLPALGLLDFAGAREQRFEIAVFGDQLRGGLDADARRAGDVVGGIAGERLNVDDLVGLGAEIGEDLLGADAPLLAIPRGGVEHRDPGADQLHQVLVGGDDQHVRAALGRLPRIGRDQVVGLIAVLLDRAQAESAHGRAHQRKLRHEVFRRIGPMRLVGRIEFAPERVLRLVEDDRQVRRLDPCGAVAQELQYLGREQPDRPDRQPVRAVIVLLILPDRLEIGSEDERRAIDKKYVVAGTDGTVGLGHGGSLAEARGEGYRGRAGLGSNHGSWVCS